MALPHARSLQVSPALCPRACLLACRNAAIMLVREGFCWSGARLLHEVISLARRRQQGGEEIHSCKMFSNPQKENVKSQGSAFVQVV